LAFSLYTQNYFFPVPTIKFKSNQQKLKCIKKKCFPTIISVLFFANRARAKTSSFENSSVVNLPPWLEKGGQKGPIYLKTKNGFWIPRRLSSLVCSSGYFQNGISALFSFIWIYIFFLLDQWVHSFYELTHFRHNKTENDLSGFLCSVGNIEYI